MKTEFKEQNDMLPIKHMKYMNITLEKKGKS